MYHRSRDAVPKPAVATRADVHAACLYAARRSAAVLGGAGAMTHAVPILVGYLFGSIPFALLISRGLTGVDIRRAGSGNVGSANVLRTSGTATALLVMVLDIAKGAGSVLLADRWSVAGSTPAVAGLAAIVGHVYPIWLRFRGGKGVATACGVFAVLTPWAVLPAFALFVATVWATRFVSLGSLVAVLALGPIAYAL